MSLIKRQTHILLLVVIMLLIGVTGASDNKREKIINQEICNSLGGRLELSENEKRVNDIIMGYKDTEWNQSYTYPENFKFSKHYFLFKEQIQASVLYRIISKMPKGAALHVHSSFTLPADYLMKITYEKNLYACVKNEVFRFRFSKSTPKLPCATQWKLMSELRDSSGDANAFDAELRELLSLVTVDDNILNGNSKTIWEKFNSIHSVTKPLLNYRLIKERYILDTLKSFYDDGIMYIELRSSISGVYELDGRELDIDEIVELYCNLTQKFIKENKDFIGVKLILTQQREKPERDLKKTLNLYKRLKAKYPKMMAGFDLVGEEERHKTLAEVTPTLFKSKNEADYFFHAGETIWYGSPADENLIDAILLGAKRIGHGFSLSKHPLLVDMVKKQDIAVEVCVVSNLVLGLVRDIRNHPLAHLLALDVPVVLSSDDPGLWDGVPASHDFYLTFLAIANKRADLRLLKQLALNSIKYSSLESKRKKKLTKTFRKQWDCFIEEVIASYDNDARRQHEKTKIIFNADSNQTTVNNLTVIPELANKSSNQSSNL